MGMKFRGRCSLSNVFHLIEVVQNFHVKFSMTFQRSDNKLMVFCYFDIADTILYSSQRWVPVTTAWRVLRLWMEEWPPIWRVAANKLNKQSRTADEGWSSSLGVGRGANNASP